MIIKSAELAKDEIRSPHRLGKVLHVINGEHFSGAERVQDLLAVGLPSSGFDVGFVCLKNGLFDANRSNHAPLIHVTMNSRFDLNAGRAVARIAQEGGYDLLHAHTPRTLLVAGMAAKMTGLPLVYHVHSPVGRDSQRWLANQLNSIVENHYLRRASKMICVSQSLKRYMQSLGHRAEKLVVVPNGVPVAKNDPIQIWNDKLIVGMVALFRPRKGTEVLLKAVSILKARGIPVHMLAVGPFETIGYESDVLDLVRAYDIEDRIKWTGFVRDVQRWLGDMHVLALPSLFGEGLPMVVLEAMARGLPVIASDVEGVPEAIRDGQDGLLCLPGSAEVLADRIEFLYRHPAKWQAMSKSCLRRQRDFLSDEAMTRRVAAVYRSLLGDA